MSTNYPVYPSKYWVAIHSVQSTASVGGELGKIVSQLPLEAATTFCLPVSGLNLLLCCWLTIIQITQQQSSRLRRMAGQVRIFQSISIGNLPTHLEPVMNDALFNSPTKVFEHGLLMILTKSKELKLLPRNFSISYQCQLLLGPYLGHQQKFKGKSKIAMEDKY